LLFQATSKVKSLTCIKNAFIKKNYVQSNIFYHFSTPMANTHVLSVRYVSYMLIFSNITGQIK